MKRRQKGGRGTEAFRPKYGELCRVVALVGDFCRVTMMTGTLPAHLEKGLIRDLGLEGTIRRVFRPIDNPKLIYSFEHVTTARLDISWLLDKLRLHEDWICAGGLGHSPCPIVFLLCAGRHQANLLYKQVCDCLYGNETRSHLTCCVGLYTNATDAGVNEYYTQQLGRGKESNIRLQIATDALGVGVDWPWIDIVVVWKVGVNLNRVMQALNRTGRYTMEGCWRERTRGIVCTP